MYHVALLDINGEFLGVDYTLPLSTCTRSFLCWICAVYNPITFMDFGITYKDSHQHL